VTFHDILDETRAKYREPLAFAPIEFEWDGVPVEVHPFAWNACGLLLEGLALGAKVERIAHWFRGWLEEHPRQGTVKTMSELIREGERVQVTIDLGSAPSEAVEHLLDVAARLKPARIKLG
jgi:hypothetical protein